MKTTKFYSCVKRGFEIEAFNLCDWFDKRASNLTKHCCNNCKHFLYEDSLCKKTNKDESPKKISIKKKNSKKKTDETQL